MALTVHVVAAFTDTLFKGNPAAIIILESWLSDELMQSIAIENNLSETAYVVKSGAEYDIRWFSPIMEIAFCGHATLAAASVLFGLDPDLQSVTFRAKAVGQIAANKLPEGFIAMDFPNRKPGRLDDLPEALLAGLSMRPQEVYVSDQAYFAVYEHEEDVLNISQDVEQIKRLYPRDVIVTAPGETTDFVSRYFWPASGGEEDPVTGSAHAGLAPLWADKLGRAELTAFQASKRGGHLRCRVEGERVVVAGQTVKYLEGVIFI
ncbi:PhzF family phenazine biosynthesis protein [Allohahella sp. A8]|uniref:PhzF family phenazine biosynthesis protein n=1 Tax=Allohahella sp. A8 TaxID=3141461 RepID=UPI003A811189